MMKHQIEMNKKNRSRSERGQVIVIMALSFVALLAALGLATDGVIVYMRKQDLSRAVDAAALAASIKMPDHTVASQAAYEYMRLHGFSFDPTTNPLDIQFPTLTPPRKVVQVTGTITVATYFLKMVGWNSVTLQSTAQGESAPLDVYLVLDTSASMTYDTMDALPTQSAKNLLTTACPGLSIDCVANYCNAHHVCAPLDTQVKPAAKFFVDQLSSQFDRIGLITYDYTAVQRIALTNDFVAVKAAIDAYPGYAASGTHNLNTATGDGIMLAHNNMALPEPVGGRMDAIWSLVLMTDGRANVYRSCAGCPPSCGASACQTIRDCNPFGTNFCTPASDWATANAEDSWTRHEITIYTIAYGQDFVDYPSQMDLMKDIADYTDNGVYDSTYQNFFQAPNQAGLQDAFAEIAKRMYSRLIH